MPENKKLIKIISVCVILSIVVVLFLTYSTLIRKPEDYRIVDEETTLENAYYVSDPYAYDDDNNTEGITLPTVTFSALSYDESPQIPQNIKTYKIKNRFGYSDGEKIAQMLKLPKGELDMDISYFYENEIAQNRGLLKFNLKGGSFSYISYGDFRIPGFSPVNPAESARKFLVSLGIADETLSCPVTYERKSLPGLIFAECHRDWAKTGLPILNFLGLINTPENRSINTLSAGYVGDDATIDIDISNTSSGQDRRKRPEDFNTATLAFDKTGKLYSIYSNLRQIEVTQDIDINEILTPDEAMDIFRKGKAVYSFISPKDTQWTNWNQVFPENRADGIIGYGNDFLLTYLENPSDPNDLLPMYLIRGTATLNNGFEVMFLQAAPALKNQSMVLGDEDEAYSPIPNVTVVGPSGGCSNDSLQLCTFTPPPSQPPPTISQLSSQENKECEITDAQLSPIINVKGLGRIGQEAYAKNGRRLNRPHQWWLIPENKNVFLTPDFIKKIKSLGLEQKDTETEALVRKLEEILADVEDPLCPVRVTGESPTLLIYGKPGDKLSIEIGKQPIIYSRPFDENNKWNIEIKPDDIITVNSRNYKSIYYEYKPVQFAKPKDGWLVKKSQISDFIRTLSVKMELTKKESESLAYELNHAVAKINYENLFISLVSSEELQNKLPIIPREDYLIQRYHFIVSPSLSKEFANEPLMPKIIRPERYILEFGAVAEL